MTVPDRDTGALIGLTIAFLGVFLGRVFDNEYLDGVASLLIGLTLGLMAVFLAYETKGLLIGEALDRETLAQLRAIITRDKAVQHIERLLTHFFGPDDGTVDCRGQISRRTFVPGNSHRSGAE